MFPTRLSDRLRLIQWALPVAITLMAALYQFGPARYVHDNYGDWSHYALEILFYGTVGPAVVWLTLRTVRGWVEAKEQAEDEVYRLNTELQQRVDERTRELSEKNLALAAANQQLEELDRLKSEFVSLVSHELRAPLTNVRGAIELMENGCPALNPTCTRMFAVVSEQILRLGRLVEEVLNLSLIESGELQLAREIVDVVEIVDRVVDEFAAYDTGHKICRPRPKGFPRLWADPDRLHQVIANLVDNAVKYSPPDSEVTLGVEIRRSECVLSVSDCGPGIPFDEQERVFEKFHRLDSSDSKETYGYGLGLYFCRRLVEAMGGHIWVESKPGYGSNFCVALPLTEP